MANTTPVRQVSIINREIWDAFNAGRLTRGHRDVGLQLAHYFKAGDAAWPSHETLAAQARCCIRTVQRALIALREAGIFDWSARWIQTGWRKVRTSNLYRRIAGHFARGDNKSYQRLMTARYPERTRQEQIDIILGKKPPRPPAAIWDNPRPSVWRRRYPPPLEPVRTPEEQIALLLGQNTPETTSTSATNASNASPSASVTAVKRPA